LKIRYQLSEEDEKIAINYFESFSKEDLSIMAFKYRGIIADYEEIIDSFLEKTKFYDSSKS